MNNKAHCVGKRQSFAKIFLEFQSFVEILFSREIFSEGNLKRWAFLFLDKSGGNYMRTLRADF